MRKSNTDMNRKGLTIMFTYWRPGKWRWEMWDRGRRIYYGTNNCNNIGSAWDDFVTEELKRRERCASNT